jgi:hypothetical protein
MVMGEYHGGTFDFQGRIDAAVSKISQEIAARKHHNIALTTMCKEQVKMVEKIRFQDRQRYAVMSAYFGAANKRLEWMGSESQNLVDVIHFLKARYKEMKNETAAKNDGEAAWLQEQLAHCKEQNLEYDIEQEALLLQEISRYSVLPFVFVDRTIDSSSNHVHICRCASLLFHARYDEGGKRCGRIALLAGEIFKKCKDFEYLELERIAAHLEFLTPGKGDLNDGQGSQRHNAAAKRVSDKRMEIDRSKAKFQNECSEETSVYSHSMAISTDPVTDEVQAVPIQEVAFPSFSLDDYKNLHASKPWEARVVIDTHAKEVEESAKDSRAIMTKRLQDLQEKADEQERVQALEDEKKREEDKIEKAKQDQEDAHAAIMDQIAKEAESVKRDLKDGSTDEYLKNKVGVLKYIPLLNKKLKGRAEEQLLEKIRITKSIRNHQKSALGESGVCVCCAVVCHQCKLTLAFCFLFM